MLPFTTRIRVADKDLHENLKQLTTSDADLHKELVCHGEFGWKNGNFILESSVPEKLHFKVNIRRLIVSGILENSNSSSIENPNLFNLQNSVHQIYYQKQQNTTHKRIIKNENNTSTKENSPKWFTQFQS